MVCNFSSKGITGMSKYASQIAMSKFNYKLNGILSVNRELKQRITGNKVTFAVKAYV